MAFDMYIYMTIYIHIIYTYCLNSLHEGFVASCTLPVSKGSNKYRSNSVLFCMHIVVMTDVATALVS